MGGSIKQELFWFGVTLFLVGLAVVMAVRDCDAGMGSQMVAIQNQTCEFKLGVVSQEVGQLQNVIDQYEFQSAQVVYQNSQLKAQIQDMGKELATLRRKVKTLDPPKLKR